MLTGKRILLVISGGIAAYKSLELIRLMRKSGADVGCILTKGGAEFITPLSVAALSGNSVYTDLFSLKDETEMGHIRLSREADLIVVAPASANMMAKMAYGMADDLASTVLLASDKPVIVCPAMNPQMWNNPATQDNIRTLEQRGIQRIGPASGDMACGEEGAGRLVEPEEIVKNIESYFAQNKPLAGYSAIVTSGPTHEPIDPVRFIGNHSSGRQGHAIAQSLSDAGAAVTLITGPVAILDPQDVKTIHVTTAREMLDACQNALPADIAVCAAAVSDWTPKQTSGQKIKKDGQAPTITLTENPDILAHLSQMKKDRPVLVIGFAAETENLIENARIKLARKQCDAIVANDVSNGQIFGEDRNQVYFITTDGAVEWPESSKRRVAQEIVEQIKARLTNQTIEEQKQKLQAGWEGSRPQVG